jgi:hypothetical protein
MLLELACVAHERERKLVCEKYEKTSLLNSSCKHCRNLKTQHPVYQSITSCCKLCKVSAHIFNFAVILMSLDILGLFFYTWKLYLKIHEEKYAYSFSKTGFMNLSISRHSVLFVFYLKQNGVTFTNS